MALVKPYSLWTRNDASAFQAFFWLNSLFGINGNIIMCFQKREEVMEDQNFISIFLSYMKAGLNGILIITHRLYVKQKRDRKGLGIRTMLNEIKPGKTSAIQSVWKENNLINVS